MAIVSCASLQPRFPSHCQTALYCFVGGGGKISSESRRTPLKFAQVRSRPAKAFEDCRLAAAHWTAGLCPRTCETDQTTLPHHDSGQGRPTHITSHFASLTAADAHIPAACLFGHSSRLYAPSIGGAPAQPSLPRVRAIYTLNSRGTLADWAKLSFSSTSPLPLVSPLAAESAGSTVISEVDLDPQRARGDPDRWRRVLHHRFRNLGTAFGALACPEGHRSHRQEDAQCPRSLATTTLIVPVVRHCSWPQPGYHLDLPEG